MPGSSYGKNVFSVGKKTVFSVVALIFKFFEHHLNLCGMDNSGETRVTVIRGMHDEGTHFQTHRATHRLTYIRKSECGTINAYQR